MLCINKLNHDLKALFIFSNKLKHLQLSYASFENIISEIKRMMEKHKLDTPGRFDDEYYVMQIERSICEILNNIFSIRDFLNESKILLLKDSGNKSIVGLHESKVKLEDKHTQILNKTLQENRTLEQSIYRLRNKLVHAGLQDTILTIYEFKKFDELEHQYVIGCDFFHLMELMNFNNIDKEFNYIALIEYFFDDKIILLRNGFINDVLYYIMLVLKKIEKEHYSKTTDSTEKFIDKLLKDPDFVFFLYRQYLVDKTADGNIQDHSFRFDMCKFIEDSYSVYIDYYLKLHSLLEDFFKQQIDELQAETGTNEKIINEVKKRYSAECPRNPYTD